MPSAKISQIIAGHIGMAAEQISKESRFKEDLGIDSLDIFEIIMEIEDEFGLEIPTEDLEGMVKVADLTDYISNRTAE
ncbi:MAG: acyl carrier protein [Desulfitobacteriia bacterium]|jgi:acyl carrier protein